MAAGSAVSSASAAIRARPTPWPRYSGAATAVEGAQAPAACHDGVKADPDRVSGQPSFSMMSSATE